MTLAELTVVVVLIGIIAAVAVPSFVAPADSMLSQAARVIAADLQYVQSLAMAGVYEHKIAFDTVTNSYRVYKVDGGSDVGVAHPWKREARFGGQYQVRFDRFTPYEGVSISVVDFGGQPWVRFGTFGNPNSKGFVELDVNGQKTWVLVHAVTGTVRVTDDVNEATAL